MASPIDDGGDARTKPNIMMTARLLLMPVLRSVELNVVLWAKAETVLRRTGGDDGERAQPERSFGASIFSCVVCIFLFSVHPPSYADISITASRSELANFAKNEMPSVVEKRP